MNTRLVDAGGFWVPTDVEEEQPWDPVEGREQTRLALAEIDARHTVTCRPCVLCGQRAVQLDDFGLCSKTSEEHQTWRKRVRSRETNPRGVFKRSR